MHNRTFPPPPFTLHASKSVLGSHHHPQHSGADLRRAWGHIGGGEGQMVTPVLLQEINMAALFSSPAQISSLAMRFLNGELRIDMSSGTCCGLSSCPRMPSSAYAPSPILLGASSYAHWDNLRFLSGSGLFASFCRATSRQKSTPQIMKYSC